MRTALAALPLIALATPTATAHAERQRNHTIYWYLCGFSPDGHRNACHEFPLRKHHPQLAGYRITCNAHPKTYCTRFPLWKKDPPPPPTATSYSQTMLVTYFTDSGLMADGTPVYWGAAACGYDLPLGTRIFVPGVGTLVCHDRIGFQPWDHIDVWGYRPGLGADYRLITIYP